MNGKSVIDKPIVDIRKIVVEFFLNFFLHLSASTLHESYMRKRASHNLQPGACYLHVICGTFQLMFTTLEHLFLILT